MQVYYIVIKHMYKIEVCNWYKQYKNSVKVSMYINKVTYYE